MSHNFLRLCLFPLLCSFCYPMKHVQQTVSPFWYTSQALRLPNQKPRQWNLSLSNVELLRYMRQYSQAKATVSFSDQRGDLGFPLALPSTGKDLISIGACIRQRCSNFSLRIQSQTYCSRDGSQMDWSKSHESAPSLPHQTDAAADG